MSRVSWRCWAVSLTVSTAWKGRAIRTGPTFLPSLYLPSHTSSVMLVVSYPFDSVRLAVIYECVFLFLGRINGIWTRECGHREFCEACHPQLSSLLLM